MDSRGSAGLTEDPTGSARRLAESTGIAIPHIEQASAYTATALQRFRGLLASESLPDTVSVCVFGSWAREELTPGSDHDWAILTKEPHSKCKRDVAKAMKIADKHLGKGDRAPGRTATFGVPFDVRTLVENIGLDHDTNRNFTRRMLLLLESRALTGTVHAEGWTEVLDRYIKNYGIKSYWPPRFLLNDIVRYWRTICVDFEGKHLNSEGNDPKWVERNAKLRTSRKLLFAGGVIPVLLCRQLDSDDMPRFLTSWLTATPLDRVAAACIYLNAESEGARALDAYDRWLAIMLDASARDELRSLTRKTRRSSKLFNEIEGIAKQFDGALLAVLFDAPLASVYRQFLVF